MFPDGSLASSDMAMLAFYVSVLGVLLLIGILLRSKVTLFKKLFLPAALIGGVVGLGLGQYGLKILPAEMTKSFGALPGTLIVIIFAPMLIGTKEHIKLRDVKDLAIPQMLVGSIGSFIQVAIPSLVTAFLLSPIWKLNAMFPSIVEIGWAGGHGTAGGMSDVFDALKWSEGTSLSLMSATIGLLVGVVGGMVMINHGIRHGYLSPRNNLSAAVFADQRDFVPADEKVANSYETINKNIAESYVLHLSIIGMAIVFGYVIKYGLELVTIKGLPLFPMAMLGGLVINFFLNKTGMIKYVDTLSPLILRRYKSGKIGFKLLIGCRKW